jgi:hypothetical protein
VRADSAGNKTNSVQLGTPDFNNTNNIDNKTVNVLVTCGDPLGNTSTRPPCPAGTVYSGNDSTTMASADLFNVTCCVSGACTQQPAACDGLGLSCSCLMCFGWCCTPGHAWHHGDDCLVCLLLTLTLVLCVCCLQLSSDIAVSKTATPDSAAVGSIFTYSVVL